MSNGAICVICNKSISEGDEYYAVMDKGGDWIACCDKTCANICKKIIVDRVKAMAAHLEKTSIEKDIW